MDWGEQAGCLDTASGRKFKTEERSGSCHQLPPFLRRLQLSIQQQIGDQRVLAPSQRKNALPRCSTPCKTLLDLMHFPW